MKTMKRILATALALVILAAMLAVPASAATTYTITINSTDNTHQYEAYQIFGGTLTAVTTGSITSHVLTEIVWGNGIKDASKTALGNAATQAAGLVDTDAAQAFAESLVSGNHLSDTPTATATWTGTGYTIANLQPGYYLIKDKSNSLDSDEFHAYTDYILRVVKNVEVSPKASTPTLTMKVSTAAASGYGEAVSAAIAHKVYFELNASMPSLIETYDSYRLIFKDTLPAGLTVDESSIKVYISNDATPSDLTELTSGYTTSVVGQNVTVDVADAVGSIIAHEGVVMVADNVIVRFAATLNPNAVIGRAGNVNRAVMQFSNDPNNAVSLGTTGEQSTEVYTYTMQLVKVDSEDPTKELPNAQFRLWRYEGSSTTDKRFAIATYDSANSTYTVTGVTANENEGTLFTTDANGQFSVRGVNAGTYRLTEVTPPAGYNKLTGDVGIQLVVGLNASTGEVDSFGANNAAPLSGTSVSVDEPNCIAILTVANTAGATLPETGGIGTTIFYILGATLMVGAATILLAKKRSTQK